MLKSLFRILSIAPVLFGLWGCSASEDSTDLLAKIGASTCISAEAFSYNGVVVKFSIPDEALDFRLSRDGISVLETADKSRVETVDTDLTPGQTYRYRCEIKIDVNIGYQVVGEEMIVTLPDSTPPTFSGLKTATLSGASDVVLGWDLTEDGLLSYFKVFKYIGVAVDKSDFPATPVATVNDVFAVSKTISNLGDELTYSFRVTACNASGDCDNNNAILTVSTPDTGAPGTIGATAAVLNNGVVSLTVPWTDDLGRVSKRSIFRASVGTGLACPAVFGSYSLVNDVLIPEPRTTATTLAAAGVLVQNTKYCFVVRDTDPTGNVETNLNVQSVEVGDITTPDFTSLLTLTRDVIDPEHILNLSFAPMVRESIDALNGVQDYLIYMSSAVAPTAPDADPCSTGTLYQTLSAAAYPFGGGNVTLNITGLNPRNNHRVCVRAIDSSSNLSVQKPNAFASTGDTTAPVFSGIQAASFNPGTASIDFTFVVPADADIRNYKVTALRTRGLFTSVILKDLGFLVAGTTAQGSFTLAEASLIDNDEVSIHVDACDDAGPTYNGSDNCSSTAAVVVLSIPDSTPPPGFSGVTLANSGVAHRSIQVSWNAPVDWTEYAGFKVYYVAGGNLIALNSGDCSCAAADCNANNKLSCIVDRESTGAFLLPSKNYELYVSAYDLAGNETTTYNAHTGGLKKTRFARAQDNVVPTFNASMVVSSVGGARVAFNVATDDQYGALEIDYEIYRREATTFLCPLTPFDPAPACDNIAPIDVVAQSTLGVDGTKRFYTDSTVVEGVTYFYQVCARDFANNKTCQAGAIGSVTIADATPPVIANVSSDKMFGVADAAWTVSFDISDNNGVAPLAISVYKGAAAYPSQAAPGVPFKTRAASSVAVVGSTATFTDTGAVDVTTAYYLIEVQDAAGNKVYYEIRDMSALPVITNVVWPVPITVDDYAVSGTFTNGVEFPEIHIQGTDLDKITFINDAPGTLATATDVLHCVTARITSTTSTEIVCDLGASTRNAATYTLYARDQHGRDITFVSGKPWNYCDYADANGITAIKGTGLSWTNSSYALCSVDHIKLIGLAADRGDGNPTDYVGYFTLGRDIDFDGVTDFKGIPAVAAGNFYLNGLNRKIMNLTIDTTVDTGDGSQNGAAFLLGCTGISPSASRLIAGVGFDNVTIKTGSGKAAVIILNNDCTWPDGAYIITASSVKNSEIHSNNTAGFYAADFKLDQGNVIASVFDSTIYSTRPDDTTAVGGAFGKVTGSAVATRSQIAFDMRRVEFRPAIGQSDAGYNIGGVIGEHAAANIDFKGGTSNATKIYGGLDNLGGIIGRFIGGTAKNNVFTNQSNLAQSPTSVNGLYIDNSGSSLNKRGGFIGEVNKTVAGAVNSLIFEGVYTVNSTILGTDKLGGIIGYLDTGSVITLRRNLITSAVTKVTNTSITGTGNGIAGVIGATNVAFTQLLLDEVEVENSNITGSNSVGGLMGYFVNSHVEIRDSSYRGGTVSSAAGASVGGLLGGHFNAGTRTFTLSGSSVGDAAISGGNRVGGLAGKLELGINNINDNYVNDNVVVTGGERVGGLFGYLRMNDVAHSMSFVHNVNHAKVIEIGATYKGAFYGQKDVTAGTLTFTNNYYKNDWPAGGGVVQTNADPDAVNEIEGMADAALSIQANYVGWDFGAIWEIRDGRAKLQNTNGLVGM